MRSDAGMRAQQAAIADMFANVVTGGVAWLDALAALADATGSARGQLIGVGPDRAQYFNWINDFGDDRVARFNASVDESGSVNHRIVAGDTDGELIVRCEADYDGVAKARPHSQYHEVAHAYDIPYGCQTKLIVDGGGMVGLAMLRSAADGVTTARDRAMFGALAPHVRSAVRIQIALEHNGPALAAGAMEQIGAAVLVCGADGRVHSMSAAAEALVRDGAITIRHGRIRTGSPAETARLRDTIARHAWAEALPVETVALGRGQPGRLPTIVEICRVGKPDRRITRSVMLIVRTGSRWQEAAPRVLQSVYGLSPAEADVALRLANGDSRAAIAEDRHASLATIRTQLKAAFAKLGVNREVELVEMLNHFLRR